MKLPKAVDELEYSHGSLYGDEEREALLEVLRAGAPLVRPRAKQFVGSRRSRRDEGVLRFVDP